MINSLLYLLIVKHFVADSLLQTRFQYRAKHRLFDPGLLLHAMIHGAFTFFLVLFIAPAGTALMFSFADAVAHWLIDWTKASVVRKFSWSSMGADDQEKMCLRIYSNNFFHAIVADQCLHFATYVMIALAVGTHE